MIPLTDEAITRIEHRVMAYTVLIFGVLSGVGSILKSISLKIGQPT